MNILIAILLGLVQGACEFLPVSSSGHLVLFQNIFGIGEDALLLDIMLHVGTLIAVFIVYRKQIWDIIRHPIQRKTVLILISTAVTAVIGFLFEDFFKNAFGGALLGIGFLITALLLFLTDRLSAKYNRKSINQITLMDATGIGVMQGVAILPGISRSGATISGCLLSGLDRETAAEYSFLLSIPAILGAAVLQIPDALAQSANFDWPGAVIGMITAAVTGYFAIRFMLKIIAKKRFQGFAIYMLALGMLVLLDQFVFNVVFAKPF